MSGRHSKGERLWESGPTLLHSDKAIARYIGRPAAQFLKIEPAGGLVLFLCAVIALLWANSPWAAGYDSFWHSHITVDLTVTQVDMSLQHWVNDGLMALFFFVVGLEIKSEIVSGELNRPKNAVTPIAAAVGGMVLPAAIYLAFNAGGPGQSGWGIPMATDIAFALGVVALFGKRIPSPARVFLLTLAIVDDLGAIVVIAVFYTASLSLEWLLAAGVIVAMVVMMRLLRVWSPTVYVALGIALWFSMLQSGVHATIAGVVMGLLISAKPLFNPDAARDWADRLVQDDATFQNNHHLEVLARGTMPPTERIQHRLHPFSTFFVLPIFALANAGVPLSGEILRQATSEPVTLGIVTGLLVGKFVGISGMAWLMVKLGWGALPKNTPWNMMLGLAMTAGIGFTVALFITELAFGGDTSELLDSAKIGVLGASAIAAIVAIVLLSAATRGRQTENSDGPRSETTSPLGER
ncbi:Na+/H+ antiporter NhaA [Haloglycomyces albus]|uniref:Na+/H+ antiporter NhaA n=1 Tax=Haloglycomyces albus TaxID=526067 RepID=UPI00046CF3F5|nr:Na+/H+ antiporter NhaA [Haloglycomyces albus]